MLLGPLFTSALHINATLVSLGDQNKGDYLEWTSMIDPLPSTGGDHQDRERHQLGTRMRQDDADRDKVWFRAVRIFHTDDGWYVGMREGNLGPFPDRQLAAIELKYYVRGLKREKVAQPA